MLVPMDDTTLKLLVNRVMLAIGSLSLVDKQLMEVKAIFDNDFQNLYCESTRGEKENSDLEFFISPPLSVYDESAE